MGNFADAIRRIRFERHMTQEEFAQLLGTSKQNISRYESGEVSPKISTAAAMARILGITLGEINGEDTTPKTSIRVPVYGTIPAGIPMEAIEDILDYEEIPAAMGRGGKEYFALKVKGDSMAPEYLDGDVIIIRQSATCDSGDDCAVMINGEDATFKRVRLSPSGMALMPINPTYEPLFFTHRQIEELPVRILGVVVELRRTKK